MSCTISVILLKSLLLSVSCYTVCFLVHVQLILHTCTHTHTHRYFISLLEGDTAASTPLARDNISALTSIFVLRQSPSLAHSSKQSPPPLSCEGLAPSLAPAEETQLLLSIQSHMERIPRLELRYCLLDAIFGGLSVDLKVRTCTCTYLDIHVSLHVVFSWLSGSAFFHVLCLSE